MTVVGLSLLFACVSFLCYKHPPPAWKFISWLQPRPVPSVAGKVTNPDTVDDVKRDLEPPDGLVQEAEGRFSPVDVTIKQTNAIRHDCDSISMPPPPVPIRPARSELQTPPARTVPSFTVSHDADSNNAPPSFPAASSAQRASGGRGPPRLNPIAKPQPPLRSIYDPNPGPITSPSTLMPPPPRGPLPNRSSSSTTSLLKPTSTTPPTRSKKVLLSPGHSPLDWAHLLASAPSLSGLSPGTSYIRVPPSLLAHHNGRRDRSTGAKKDAWTALGGKVYNITPYLAFHPGGEGELLKAAGKDGTRLFNEVHPWVSWEGMLEPGCLVGVAVKEGEGEKVSSWDEMD